MKKLTSLHQAMVKHLDDCIKTGDVSNWIIESRTVLLQKKSLPPFKPAEPNTRGTERLSTKN